MRFSGINGRIDDGTAQRQPPPVAPRPMQRRRAPRFSVAGMPHRGIGTLGSMKLVYHFLGWNANGTYKYCNLVPNKHLCQFRQLSLGVVILKICVFVW